MKRGERIDTATVLADRLLELLKKGVSPWHKPWKGGDCFPVNWQGREYRGMNVFMLALMGYENPYWLTFRKGQELGGCVRKGEKGCPVMYWQRKEFIVKDKDGKTVLDSDGEPEKRTAMLIRGYTVFNAEQFDGLPDKYKTVKATPKKVRDPHRAAKKIWDGYVGKPELQHGGGRACYSPSRDLIRLPPKAMFDDAASYWSTLFHEGCHSTGHESRLDRKFGKSFGDEQYSKEELIAEMGAQLLCQRCGITRTLENAAAYCKGWAEGIKSMPDYGKAVVCAAAQAQKAADWILGIRFHDDTNNKEENYDS